MVGYQPGGAPLWLAAAAPAGLLLAVWPMAWMLQRQRRLLSEGRAVAARVVGSTRTQSQHGNVYRVEYEYRVLSGATRRVTLQASKKPPEPGATVTMIYDRDDSHKAALYPLPLAAVASRSDG